MTYAPPAWATIPPQNLQALQGLENRILRTILNAELQPLTDYIFDLNTRHFTKADTSANPIILNSHIHSEPGATHKYPRDQTQQQ